MYSISSTTMSIDKMFEMVEHMEVKAAELYQQKRILRSTLALIRHKCKEIRETLAEISDDSYERETILGEISKELEILSCLIKAITNGNTGDAATLAHELLSTVVERCSLDIFLTESPVYLSSLREIHYREENELTFFLLCPESDYLETDRIGLIAHETSHTHEAVHRYTESTNAEKRKIGESLADILGLCTAGPLFVHSLSFFIINDFGLHRIRESYGVHPSWAARITVLHYANVSLWTNAILKEAVHRLLAKVLCDESPPLFDDLFIAKCMREYDNHKKAFSRFKLDERRIVSFKNGEGDSLLYRLNRSICEVT